MKCPKCQHQQSRVLDTIRVRDGLRRHRLCSKCKHRFATLERIEVWDQTLHGYVAAADERPPLAAVPDHFVEPPKKVAAIKGHVAQADDILLGFVIPEAQPLLLQWWNESRRSKHKQAAWTKAAWEGSVKRVADLPSWQQVALAQAGVESGWQTLRPEYIKDVPAPAAAACGRPMPKDPAMLAALESWPKQTA